MKKAFRSYLIYWAILFALFNIIVFATPNELGGYVKIGGAFWSGYIFIALAMIGQLVCTLIALNQETLTKVFYNVPIIRLGRGAMIVSFILGTLCMMIPDLPNWVGMVLCVFVLGLYARAIVKAGAAAEIIADIDEKVESETMFIRNLTSEAELLQSQAKTTEAKALCKKVYEALRYSDPMSSALLSSIEYDIDCEFAKFSNAVKAEDAEGIKAIGETVLFLIADRNKKCLTMK